MKYAIFKGFQNIIGAFSRSLDGAPTPGRVICTKVRPSIKLSADDLGGDPPDLEEDATNRARFLGQEAEVVYA